MRYLILAAGAALSLAACSNNNDAQNADNGVDLQVGNLVVENTGDMNAMAPTDMNAVTTNDTQNAMMNDLTHNDADTNLANGT
jgi:hypothetical protein